MARQTFQGRMRTTAGRARSGINRDTGLPTRVLHQNLLGPIQLVLRDPEDGPHDMGLLPAFWCVDPSAFIITAATAGTFQIDLPAYAGLAEANVIASGTDATTAGSATVALAPFQAYSKDRPLVLTTTGVTGLLRVGLMGFPLDNQEEAILPVTIAP